MAEQGDNGVDSQNGFAPRSLDALASEADLQRDRALADLDLNELGARWRKVTGRPAPKAFRTEMLRRALAYEMQVAAFGGLSASLMRQLRDLARAAREDRFDEALGTIHLKPGTILMRVWEGRTENVMVTRDCYVWSGERYTSLSAIAKAITGTSWEWLDLLRCKAAERAKQEMPRRRETPELILMPSVQTIRLMLGVPAPPQRPLTL